VQVDEPLARSGPDFVGTHFLWDASTVGEDLIFGSRPRVWTDLLSVAVHFLNFAALNTFHYYIRFKIAVELCTGFVLRSADNL
jgi:hypothetical protein